jgi:cytoskeletal protein CcmA (bactofilin family)
MVTLLEVVAMLTLGGFGLAYFRRRLRRGAMMAILLAGVCSFAAMTVPPASASDMRKGDFVEVAQGENIKGDVFLFGHRARVNGTVEGDVYMFSEDAVVNGTVKGDVIAFAQSLHVNGHVDGNIRSCSNNITVTGEVTRNILTFNEVVNIDQAAKVGGSITVFAKSLSLDGQLGRDLTVFSEHAGLSGKIGGSVKAKGNSLDISSSAQVDGPVRFEGNHEPQVASGAKLASAVEFHKAEHKPKYMEGHYYLWQVIWLAAFVLFGLVLFVLMPQFAQEAVNNVERYGASFGLGDRMRYRRGPVHWLDHRLFVVRVVVLCAVGGRRHGRPVAHGSHARTVAADRPHDRGHRNRSAGYHHSGAWGMDQIRHHSMGLGRDLAGAVSPVPAIDLCRCSRGRVCSFAAATEYHDWRRSASLGAW